MKKIAMFECVDGALFATAAEATKHENYVARDVSARAVLAELFGRSTMSTVNLDKVHQFVYNMLMGTVDEHREQATILAAAIQKAYNQ